MKKIFIITFTFLTLGCVCKEQNVAQSAPVVVEQKKPEPVLIDKIIDSYNLYHASPYNGVIVKQSGMRYAIFYVGGETFILNLTKDSLEVVVLKRQTFKDSLQIEVSRKYLKN